MKIEELIQQPEGRKLEFKETLPRKADLNKTIVSFANDAGGSLILGVKDNPREVIGVPEQELIQLEETISASIHDRCTPVILPDISFQKIRGQYILIIHIAKGNTPPYHLRNQSETDGTYIRVGSSNRKANQGIIEELYRKRSNVSFDSVAIYDKTIDKLDFHSFQKHFQENAGEELSLTILKKLNLVHKEHSQNFPTHAFVLLSDDPIKQKIFPYGKIECARFKGDTPGNFIDQKTIDSPLSIQAEQAYQFLLRHISQGSSYEGVYRKDRWEYPIIALREVIRNAIIHRDYALTGKDIKLAVFDDKIEITSPGNLLPTVDFNEMESGQSDIRNKILAPVFKKIGIIEQWGNGLKLIADDLKQYPEIKFQWRQPGMSFRAIFLRKENKERQNLKVKTDYDRLRPITTDYDRLGLEEKRTLLYLLDNRKITKKEAVKLLGFGETKTKEILNNLVEKKLIIRRGKGRGTYYTLEE